MKATMKRRLDRASLNVDSVWRDAWDAWALEVVAEWRRIDPHVTQHFSVFQRYEQEWVALSTAEERAGFLRQGTSLCEQEGLSGSLWGWFWRDVYGPVLDGDLSAWPRLIVTPHASNQTPSKEQLATLLMKTTSHIRTGGLKVYY